MLPKGSAKSTVYLFVFFLLLLVTFVVYNLLTTNLSVRNANAGIDNASGEFIYTKKLANLQSLGTTYNWDRYFANTADDPYQLETPKRLSSIKITGTNILPEVQVLLCVESLNLETKAVNDVLCDTRTVGNSASAEWQETLTYPLLAQPNQQYYCEVKLILNNTQAVVDARALAAANFNCELIFKPLEPGSKVYTTIAAHQLVQVTQGVDLVPSTISYATLTNTTIAQLRGVVTADASVNEQSFFDICLRLPQDLKCLETLEYDSRVANANLNTSLEMQVQLAATEQFSFSCKTQEGRTASCLLFALVELPQDSGYESADSGSILTKIIKQNFANVDAYCRDNLYDYNNEGQFISYSDSETKIARCQGLLTSN